MHLPFLRRHTIIGDDGTAYMTRYWIGRLRLHIFSRGDQDRDPHDHPWDFWTFPLTSYVEEVIQADFANNVRSHRSNWISHTGPYRRVVRAFRLHYRPATHTHRVLGRALMRRDKPGVPVCGVSGEPLWTTGKIVTIVWRGSKGRSWGFLKNRDGKWCWVSWQQYLAGKDAPCE